MTLKTRIERLEDFSGSGGHPLATLAEDIKAARLRADQARREGRELPIPPDLDVESYSSWEDRELAREINAARARARRHREERRQQAEGKP